MLYAYSGCKAQRLRLRSLTSLCNSTYQRPCSVQGKASEDTQQEARQLLLGAGVYPADILGKESAKCCIHRLCPRCTPAYHTP